MMTMMMMMVYIFTLSTTYFSPASFKSGIELARTMMISVPTYLQLQIYVMVLKQVRFDDDDGDGDDDDDRNNDECFRKYKCSY
jgi:hypothetical protein